MSRKLPMSDRRPRSTSLEISLRSRARLIELVRRAAVFHEQLLDLLILRRKPRFEFLDVRRLELGLVGRGRFTGVGPRPPAPVGNFQIVRHREEVLRLKP